MLRPQKKVRRKSCTHIIRNGDRDIFMCLDPSNNVVLSAEFEGGMLPKNRTDGEPIKMPGGTFPLGWTRSYGDGKVFVTLLGHDGLSFQTPEFQRIVLNGVDWSTS